MDFIFFRCLSRSNIFRTTWNVLEQIWNLICKQFGFFFEQHFLRTFWISIIYATFWNVSKQFSMFRNILKSAKLFSNIFGIFYSEHCELFSNKFRILFLENFLIKHLLQNSLQCFGTFSIIWNILGKHCFHRTLWNVSKQILNVQEHFKKCITWFRKISGYLEQFLRNTLKYFKHLQYSGTISRMCC